MICEERLLEILRAPHASEKASNIMDKYNTIVFKVAKNSTKAEIKAAVSKLFEVKVNEVSTLIIKRKIKRQHHRHREWKKAYITLKEGQNLNFLGSTE